MKPNLSFRFQGKQRFKKDWLSFQGFQLKKLIINSFELNPIILNFANDRYFPIKKIIRKSNSILCKTRNPLIKGELPFNLKVNKKEIGL